MTTISNLFSNGSATPIVKGKKAYEPTSVKDMRDGIIARICADIEALKDFVRPTLLKDAELECSMVTPRNIGFKIKIGHGAKNEALSSELIGHVPSKEDALATLEDFKTAFELKEFDDLLEAKLESYRERAAKGKEARKNNNVELKAVS